MSAESWYRSWFDSPYYHILYSNRDDEEAAFFIDRILKYLDPTKKSTFLDMACGKGRHSIYINQKGYSVTGIDLSKNSIASAREHENDGLKFFVHDMRLPFREAAFDYVLNLFTSFGYFHNKEQNLNVLKAAHYNLKYKGKLVIDFMNVSKVVTHLTEDEEIRKGEITFRIHRNFCDGFIQKEIVVEDEGRNFHFKEEVLAITKQEFLSMLRSTGFEVLDIFGNYNLGEYHSEESDRLIIVARKTA